MDDERLLLETGANHYRGLEAMGGKLSLTNKRLIFRSHKLNVQNHQQEFSISEIKTVIQGNGILSKTFKLGLANNETHRFLVDSPSDWLKTISH